LESMELAGLFVEAEFGVVAQLIGAANAAGWRH
jgi:hypothetical protein